jgi:hypothetical protein
VEVLIERGEIRRIERVRYIRNANAIERNGKRDFSGRYPFLFCPPLAHEVKEASKQFRPCLKRTTVYLKGWRVPPF